jgi:hypothetical protein
MEFFFTAEFTEDTENTKIRRTDTLRIPIPR